MLDYVWVNSDKLFDTWWFCVEIVGLSFIFFKIRDYNFLTWGFTFNPRLSSSDIIRIYFHKIWDHFSACLCACDMNIWVAYKCSWILHEQIGN